MTFIKIHSGKLICLVGVLILLCIGAPVFAQDEDCEQKLKIATEEFNAGHFYNIPLIINNCLSIFTKEQRQRAYLLLTQTYLLTDDQKSAKESYLQLLYANPEFQTDTAIHSFDVIYLGNNYTSAPIFSVYLNAGINTAQPQVIYNFNTYGSSDVKEQYEFKMGFQAAIGGEFHLLKRIGVCAELNYLYTSYGHQTTNYFSDDKKEFQDRLSWLTLPILLKYSDVGGRFRPYGYVGYSLNYLLTDRANITVISPELTESPNLDLRYKRNMFNQAFILGLGLKKKIGLSFFFIDVRYNIGIKNIVKESSNFGDYSKDSSSEGFNNEFQSVISYTHIDDYFRLDNLALSVGLYKPLYRPREVRKNRLKNFLRISK